MIGTDRLTVGFTGSRNYPRPDLVANFVRLIARKYPAAHIISGGRGNVDETAEKTGVECGMEVVSYRPTDSGIEIWNWSPETGEWKGAKPILGHGTFVRNCFFRNGFIAACDRVIGFWDLNSRGTADTISKALAYQHTTKFVYGPDGEQLSLEQIRANLDRVLG